MLKTSAALIASAALFTACSGSVSVESGAKTLDKDDVAQTVSEKLTEQVGQAPDDVTCPTDLDAEVGAEMTCQLTVEDQSLDVAVSVISYEDGKADFDIEVLDPNAG